MKIFETERLIIKRIESKDKKYFAELFTDTKILELIPVKPSTEEEIKERFDKNLKIQLEDLNTQKCLCGIYEKGNTELIGLAMFLINEEGEKELGYRFRVDFWGKGYGTETTKGMLEYYFLKMNVNKVTADANIANIGSVKILDKFFKLVKEYFNEKYQCTDRKYELEKRIWLQNRA